MTNLRGKAAVLSGEVFKESFIDIFHTNLEQVAFSTPCVPCPFILRSKTRALFAEQTKAAVLLRAPTGQLGVTFAQQKPFGAFATVPFGERKLPVPLLACPFLPRRGTARHGKEGGERRFCPFLPVQIYDLQRGTAQALLTPKRGNYLRAVSCPYLRAPKGQLLTNRRFVRTARRGKKGQLLTNQRFVSTTRTERNFFEEKALQLTKKIEKKPLQGYTLYADLSTKKVLSQIKGRTGERNTVLKALAFKRVKRGIEKAKPVFTRKRASGFTFKKNFALEDQSKNTPVLLNKKIGDYLSSGDKVGTLRSLAPFLREQGSCRAYKSPICGASFLPLRGTGKPCRACPFILRSKTKAFATVPYGERKLEALLPPTTYPCLRAVPAVPRTGKKGQLLAVSPKGATTCRFLLRKTGTTRVPELLTGAKHDAQTLRLEKGKERAHPIILNCSGRVLTISKTQLVLQKTQPVLFYNSASLHVKKGEWVKAGSPILTLTHQTLITGDIVQGIPRIEQLFEAFTSPPSALKDRERGVTRFQNVHDTLHSRVRDIFRKHWFKSVLPIAVRKSLEEIQYILVESIQKVYLSQGVLISDKHIEIIIRQIASKGQILDSGSTGLFLEEILPIRQIENANLVTPGKKCLYVPAVVGLTAAALSSDSFISAASFQETTRVLSRDAFVGKSDFLRGLKEKVVIGDLISAGTGLDIYFVYRFVNTGVRPAVTNL